MARSSAQKTGRPWRLGIDLGSGSVGWAVVLEDADQSPVEIGALGVRRFEAGVLGDIESGKDESRATARRNASGPRRLTWRRQHRMRKVFRRLQQMNLLPASGGDSHDQRHNAIHALDQQLLGKFVEKSDHTAHQLLPYLLRARALDERIERHEFGRALYHLAQRRGFQSNLKAAKDDEDQGVVKAGISELQQAIDSAGARTLGEYFASLDPDERRIRKRWTARSMYMDEFRKIWDAQAAHHDDLTDEQRESLFEAIFFQRPLKSQKHLVGLCDLEHGKRRAPAACLEFQEFRVLQRVNDLEIIQPDGECRPLEVDERAKLLTALEEDSSRTFGGIRKLFKMKKSREYGRNYTFNFETGGDKSIIGNRTSAKLLEVLGERWRGMPLDERKRLVDDILSFEAEEPLIRRLTNGWAISKQDAAAIANLTFEQGYGALSRRALQQLLPMMREGIPFATARKQVYGEEEQGSEPVDLLPSQHECGVLRHLRNPAVARALSELRKVTNALVRRYGKPRSVHIELARDLKHSRLTRKRMTERNRENEKSREDARKEILDAMKGDESRCTRTNILKVRLAKECGWICPFTGKGISMKSLVGEHPQFDIEHIIPFSRSLDNSYMNNTLCYHDENRHVKGNKTPWEAYADTEKWDEIVGRVRRFNAPQGVVRRKLELFQTEKLPDTGEFSQRQLNDTRYMSVLAAEYLGLLYGGQIDQLGKRRVQVSPGRVTSYLRQRWSLNAILGHADKKDRADHRHHAIDALVVALTDSSAVRSLSKAAEKAEELAQTSLFVPVDPPWDEFEQQARDAVAAIHVSSRVSRKLLGRLHQDTIYSKPQPAPNKGGKEAHVHHLRKELKKLTKNEIENIVDDRIRQIVEKHLSRHGGNIKKAFSDESNHPYMKAKDGRVIPIHKVRIRRSDKPMTVGSGSKTRYVNPGSNHHMAIVAKLDDDGNETKWRGDLVNRFEAVQRHRQNGQIIMRENGERARFKFSLTGGEHVLMNYDGESEKLYRVVKISEKEAECVLHSDARPSTLRAKIGAKARVRTSPEKLRKCGARKVIVDPLGNVFPAND